MIYRNETLNRSDLLFQPSSIQSAATCGSLQFLSISNNPLPLASNCDFYSFTSLIVCLLLATFPAQIHSRDDINDFVSLSVKSLCDTLNLFSGGFANVNVSCVSM